tara:strand:- start:2 stop:736 length:735 start_codon:yes stop_codon:yes gene_type:complete
MTRLLILQHLEREGPGLFSKVAHQRGIPVFTFRLDLDDAFPQIEKKDLLLILGGPMSLNDINSPKYPWMLKELEIIQEALNKGIRVIGVCLGAQLLAKAAGGDVEPLIDSFSSKSLPEVGWSPISLTEDSNNNFFDSVFGTPLDVLHWHGDRILLPKSARLIGSSQRCKEQFFQIGEFAYGIQFHIEIDSKMVKRWVEEDFEFIRLTYGPNAKKIILKQQNIYCDKTIDSRLFFIEKLFEAVNI